MCITCSDIISLLKNRGYTEEEAIDYLWEFTPIPVAPPTLDHLIEVTKIKNTKIHDAEVLAKLDCL